MPTPPKSSVKNQLFYGDNLDILRKYIADDSVDLIYLDPPFNSNATYNVLFRTPGLAGGGGLTVRRRSRRSTTPGTGARQPSARSTR